MIQQINLYQQEFRAGGNQNRVRVAAVLALLLLLFGGSVMFLSIRVSELEQTLAASQRELGSLQQSYSAMQKSIQPRAMDMNLAERVLKLKRSNEEKIRAKNYLAGDGAGNLTGFSSLLQGLGRQRDRIEELWLKKIEFSDGGYEMRLSGSHYRPELLPEFIQALNDEDLYRDREFRQIRINRSTQNKAVTDFVLATRSDDGEIGKRANRLDVALFMSRLKRLSEVGVTQ